MVGSRLGIRLSVLWAEPDYGWWVVGLWIVELVAWRGPPWRPRKHEEQECDAVVSRVSRRWLLGRSCNS